MPRTTITLFMTTVIALGAGAAGSRFIHPQSGIAVVDLDRVAKELGRDVLMANDFKANQNSLLNELTTIQKDANEKLKKMEEDLGADAPAEEKQKLKQTADAAQLGFNQLQKQADAKLSQRRDFLVANFRQEARPIVDRVAKAQGAKVVVTDSVLFTFDHTIDITNAVIAEMRMNPPAPAAPLPVPAPAVAQEPASSPEASAAIPPRDSQVRHASASTTKPAPKTRPVAPKADE